MVCEIFKLKKVCVKKLIFFSLQHILTVLYTLLTNDISTGRTFTLLFIDIKTITTFDVANYLESIRKSIPFYTQTTTLCP